MRVSTHPTGGKTVARLFQDPVEQRQVWMWSDCRVIATLGEPLRKVPGLPATPPRSPSPLPPEAEPGFPPEKPPIPPLLEPGEPLP